MPCGNCPGCSSGQACCVPVNQEFPIGCRLPIYIPSTCVEFPSAFAFSFPYDLFIDPICAGFFPGQPEICTQFKGDWILKYRGPGGNPDWPIGTGCIWTTDESLDNVNWKFCAAENGPNPMPKFSLYQFTWDDDPAFNRCCLYMKYGGISHFANPFDFSFEPYPETIWNCHSPLLMRGYVRAPCPGIDGPFSILDVLLVPL